MTAFSARVFHGRISSYFSESEDHFSAVDEYILQSPDQQTSSDESTWEYSDDEDPFGQPYWSQWKHSSDAGWLTRAPKSSLQILSKEHLHASGLTFCANNNNRLSCMPSVFFNVARSVLPVQWWHLHIRVTQRSWPKNRVRNGREFTLDGGNRTRLSLTGEKSMLEFWVKCGKWHCQQSRNEINHHHSACWLYNKGLAQRSLPSSSEPLLYLKVSYLSLLHNPLTMLSKGYAQCCWQHNPLTVRGRTQRYHAKDAHAHWSVVWDARRILRRDGKQGAVHCTATWKVVRETPHHGQVSG